MTFKEFQATNAKRCKELQGDSPNSSDMKDFAIALAGETGEVCNDVKKIGRILHGYKFKDIGEIETYLKQLEIEIADVVCYAFLLASAINADLELAIVKKFNQVSSKNDCITFISQNNKGEYHEIQLNPKRERTKINNV